MIAAVLRLRALTPLALALLAAALALPLLGAALLAALPVALLLAAAFAALHHAGLVLAATRPCLLRDDPGLVLAASDARLSLRHRAGLVLAATDAGLFVILLSALPIARLLALAGALLPRLEAVLIRPLAPSACRAALVVAEPATSGPPVAVAVIEARASETESRPPETLGPRDEDPPPETIDPEAAAERLAYDADLLDQTVSAQRRRIEGRQGGSAAARQHGPGQHSQDRQRICRFHMHPDPIK